MSQWLRSQRLRQLDASVRRRLPRRHAVAQTIPDKVKSAWFAGVEAELPGWQPDESDWRLSSLALLQFFEICGRQAEGQSCALPSKAADSVWHIWMTHDPLSLAQWQRRLFGKEIPHREAAELGEPLPGALARTLAAACRLEGSTPLYGELPLLFVLDGQLEVPGGWAYERRLGMIYHRTIDARGRAVGVRHRHVGLMPASLAALGLLPAPQQLALARADKNVGGSNCGSACGSSTLNGGGNACGHGDGGGCSCGSSCGSGCGGACGS